MTELIGREKEIEQIEHFFGFDSGRSKVVSIHGQGGIGKTALLRTLRQRLTTQPDIVATELIDLVDERLSQVRWLRSEIATQLDPVNYYFETYYSRLHAYDQKLARYLDFHDIDESRSQVDKAFVSAYEHLVVGKKRIVLFLDTVEAIESHREIWVDAILPFLGMLPFTHFVFAGRDPHIWRPLINRQLSTLHELSIPLSGFTLDETKLYFDQSRTGQDTAVDLQEKIHLLTNGRPIMIDLAVEWSRRNLPFESLSQIGVDTLRDLVRKPHNLVVEALPDSRITEANATLQVLAEEFERELIENILELPAKHKLPILSMVYLHQYGLNLALLDAIANAFLSSTIDNAGLFNEIRDFVFVKSIPGDRLILHDEAKKLIEDYQLWERYDGSRQIRNELFALLQSYFKKTSEHLDDSIEKSKGNPYSEQEFLYQQITKLRCQQLRFAFELDPDEGFRQFVELFERSTDRRLFLLSEGLIGTSLEYVHTESRRIQLQLMRIGQLFATSEYELAEKMARELLENPDVPDIARVELYFQLGNITINSGRGVLPARRFYEIALELCRELDLKSKQPKLLNELGYIYRLQGNLNAASELYKTALLAARDVGDIVEEMSALVNWSYVDSRLGEFEQGYRKLRQVAQYIHENDVNDRELIARYHSVLGELARYEGKYDEAIKEYDRSLQQFSSPEDEAWPGLIISQRGAAYLNRFIEDPASLNDITHAKDDLLRAVRLCRRSNKNVLPMALHRLGRCYQAMEEYETAVRTFREGYHIAKLQGDWQFVVENLTNLSEVMFYQWQVFEDSGLVDVLKENFEEINELAQKGFSYPHLFGKMQQILGNILIIKGQYGEALELYLRSIRNLTAEERFVGRDRLDNRLREMEPLVLRMPPEWQTKWWRDIHDAAMESGYASEPTVLAYLDEQRISSENTRGIIS